MNLSLPFWDLALPPQADALPSVSAEGVATAEGAGPVAGAGVEPALAAACRVNRLVLLHPALWRASQIGGAPRRCTASGFAALDAQLPGGGWPHGVLTELLLPNAGMGELRLLAPALAAVAPAGEGGAPGAGGAHRSADEGRCVMLFDPPAALSAWALLQGGLSPRHWLVVKARAGPGRAAAAGRAGTPRSANGKSPLLASADLLWALAQALKSGHVGAILAWLPLNLRADTLRRLQIAAQAHDGPVFIFRDALARSQPSPAPLRLLLQPAGVDGLRVRLIKRRGPALDQPLFLCLPSALTPQQQAQALTGALLHQAVQGPGLATAPGCTAPALARETAAPAPARETAAPARETAAPARETAAPARGRGLGEGG